MNDTILRKGVEIYRAKSLPIGWERERSREELERWTVTHTALLLYEFSRAVDHQITQIGLNSLIIDFELRSKDYETWIEMRVYLKEMERSK